MKKKLFFALLAFFLIFNVQDVKAFSAADYQYKNLCGNYEVDGMHSDGVQVTVSCHNTFEEAKNFMTNNGADDLVIMTKVNGLTKIVDANVGLADLTVNPEQLTYYFNDANLSHRYTYMFNGSSYGAVDGAVMAATINSKGQHVIKVRLANYTGWIKPEAYEIVPITWVRSSSSYTVTNDTIRHNYVSKIQNSYNGSMGSTIGPKPDMLSPGTYYSYDGHWFYRDIKTMIKDYRNERYSNSVNQNNTYYNYYMYLSNHTRSNYSSANLDEYIRNNLNIKMDIYGDLTDGSTSRFYGAAIPFYYAQEKYGVNMLLAYSLSKNETATGRSPLATQKNNGFGLNAVDSDPYHAATWYATFAQSILGYASTWITYGYAHPRDGRYFGPQFGDKFIGMNVSYASDAFWSEKMASNYFQFDRSKGMQDYNFYQLGVVRGVTNAYQSPNTSSRRIYQYPEAEDGLVVVGETTGTTVNGSNKWYEVVSDLNLNNDYNERTGGDYNWNKTVYVHSSDVKLINKAKSGYKSPNDVSEYPDTHYTYDYMMSGTRQQPRVAISNKDTEFYHDSTLLTKKGQVLKNNRYVMVYAIAYDGNGNIKSYLVTSDYKMNQKHWVKASDISLVSKAYAYVNLYTVDNVYTWVNSRPEDTQATLISGLYIDCFVPVLDKKQIGSDTWLKVPVDISGDKPEFGWTLKDAYQVELTVYGNVEQNSFPVITANDKKQLEGKEINLLDGVTAVDPEDGDLTSKVKVRESNVDTTKPGHYKVVYEVTDNNGQTTTKEISVEITENHAPVIEADDIELIEKQKLVEHYKAYDTEDGDITLKVEKTKDTVNVNTPGTYEIVYKVKDSNGKETTKTVKVTVIKDEEPVIVANDITLTKGVEFKPLENVIATDKEDIDLTSKITVKTNTVDITKEGTYKVIYEVKDSFGHIVSKEIKATVVKDQDPQILAEDLTIFKDEKFDPLKVASAYDPEDKDISSKLKVTKNTVDSSKIGEYTVTYEVEDSNNNKVVKTIKVSVVKVQLTEVSGRLTYKTVNNKDNKLNFLLSETIDGIDNSLNTNITYRLIFENVANNEEISFRANRITNKSDIPKQVYSPDGLDYTYSWFNANIDINDLKVGNYKIYVVAQSDLKYSKTLLVNKVYNEQATTVKTDDKYAVISNNYQPGVTFIELRVRKENIGNKTTSYIYNQYDKYTKLEFKEDKLYIRGNTYSYGMDLNKNANVDRKIIFENTRTYKTYSFDLSSITNGNYTVALPVNDNLDKTKAWYDKELDLSELEVGNYSIYISTKANLEDTAELNEKLGRDLSGITKVINGKKYSFTINKQRNNRIELIVEEA